MSARTVVALGDSTTAGTPDWQSPVEAPPVGRGDATAPWTYRLSQLHPTWTIHNCGVNGERSDQILERFDRDVLAARPHIVVIIAGVNDVYQGRSAESVTANLSAMYARAKVAGIRVVAGSIVPYDTATPDQNARMHAVNDWIVSETTRDPNVTFADTRQAAAAPGNIDRLSGSPDGLHPDKDGYRRMAECIDHALSTMRGFGGDKGLATSRAVHGGLVMLLASVVLSAQVTGWEAFVAQWRAGVTQHAIVGSAVAQVERGQIVARATAGQRDAAASLPVTDDTIFHWASITKTLTAIGVMQLRDRGLISLDDPVVQYVPELRTAHNPFAAQTKTGAITIRQLLSHSAGFRAGTWPWVASGARGDQSWQPFEPPSWDQLVAMLPYTAVEFAPGTTYGYSNPGYVYLGRVIEDVTGQPFETYIDKEIWRPLGMTRTFFDQAPSYLRGDRSHSYFVDDGGRAEARFDFDTGITVMNGGMNAPLADLAKYLGLLQGGADAAMQTRYDAIIRRSSLEEMWTRVVPVSAGVDMGLGFFLETHGGRRFVAHSGGQNGFISHFWLDRDSKKAAIVVFNTQTESKAKGDARNTRALDAAMRDALVALVFR